MNLSKESLIEAAEEAARVIFHGMHPGSVGRRDEPPECRGFKAEMARIIKREVEAKAKLPNASYEALEAIIREGDPVTATKDWPDPALFAEWAIDQACAAIGRSHD